MKFQHYLFFFFLSFTNPLSAQTAHLEVVTGVEFGWWFHQLGSSLDNGVNDLGVAKTHHSPAPSISGTWLWNLKKWQLGPTLQIGALIEDDMRGPADSRRRAYRIPIAKEDSGIPMLRYGLHLEYALLNRGAYTFAPAFRYGAMQWRTLHPGRANFGYKHFRDLVFSHIWHLKKRDLILRMNYSTFRIFLKEKANSEERHHLYFWGTSLGIRF